MLRINRSSNRTCLLLGVLCVASAGALASRYPEEYLSGMRWASPVVVTPAPTLGGAPSDATVLFDGRDLEQWRNGESWTVQDGSAVVGAGDLTTKESFGDCQLHIEWSAPVPAEGTGQGRGNSGVFLMDTYEIQVLDSYRNDTYPDGQAGAIYKQTPPAVNAMRPPGEWNTYDIFWTCPRFDESGMLLSPAFVTLLHNGVLVLNHFELAGDTPYHRAPSYTAHGPKGPIRLQDHGNPVRYRNIWVREWRPAPGARERGAYLRDGDKETALDD